MGIFDRFPYSSTHEMNLDFMLGKATEIAEDMQQVTAGMEQVQAGLEAISEKTEQATQAAAQAAASASSIEGSVTAAEEAAEEAQMHNESAQTWANNALTYKADCQRAATEAAASSSSAAQAATAAAASEDTVATYAQAANASAQSAANNNDSAHQYANQASASASNATFHSSNAQTAATNAQTAATNANTSATNASASADRAATLKDDVETLHRMCVAAVDQAATQAANAANSAAQAATTKTDVETLVESLPEDFTDLNNTVNQLSDEIDDLHEIIYPNEDTVFSEFSDSALTATNQYKSIRTLAQDHTYRLVLSFSADPVNLTAIRTSKSQSGVGNVDTLTSMFTGDSWTTGKTMLYTPADAGIQYMQFQFNSAYTGDLTASLTIYDYEKEQKTAIDELSATIAKNTTEIKEQEYVIDLDMAYNLLPSTGYETNKLISTTGEVGDSPSGFCLSDYIPLDENQSYICNFTKTASVVNGDPALTGNLNTFERFYFCFFDADKNPITFTGDAAAVSKAIPQGAKYIRVTCSSEQLYKLAVLIYGNFETQPIIRPIYYKKTQQHAYDAPNTGMENLNMVMFGDSITHGSLSAGTGFSYVDYANDFLHSHIINVGFGGTRMTYPTLSDNYLFQFRNLIDCIVSDDASAWDALDAYASTTDYGPHLTALKAVDWNKMHAIGLMYGANDFTSNTPVGTAYNEDVANFDGACASALKKLLTKYPHLQVILFGPFDRMLNISDPTTMTDTTPNSIGLYMKDYANSLENVVSKFHCPLIKTGELLGINAQTILTYAPDGTHPRANIGQKRLGWIIAQAIKNCIAPFNTFD